MEWNSVDFNILSSRGRGEKLVEEIQGVDAGQTLNLSASKGVWSIFTTISPGREAVYTRTLTNMS